MRACAAVLVCAALLTSGFLLGQAGSEATAQASGADKTTQILKSIDATLGKSRDKDSVVGLLDDIESNLEALCYGAGDSEGFGDRTCKALAAEAEDVNSE